MLSWCRNVTVDSHSHWAVVCFILRWTRSPLRWHQGRKLSCTSWYVVQSCLMHIVLCTEYSRWYWHGQISHILPSDVKRFRQFNGFLLCFQCNFYDDETVISDWMRASLTSRLTHICSFRTWIFPVLWHCRWTELSSSWHRSLMHSQEQQQASSVIHLQTCVACNNNNRFMAI